MAVQSHVVRSARLPKEAPGDAQWTALPPKAICGLAARRVVGRVLTPSDDFPPPPSAFRLFCFTLRSYDQEPHDACFPPE
jgi:hypothetical protein